MRSISCCSSENRSRVKTGCTTGSRRKAPPLGGPAGAVPPVEVWLEGLLVSGLVVVLDFEVVMRSPFLGSRVHRCYSACRWCNRSLPAPRHPLLQVSCRSASPSASCGDRGHAIVRLSRGASFSIAVFAALRQRSLEGRVVGQWWVSEGGRDRETDYRRRPDEPGGSHRP